MQKNLVVNPIQLAVNGKKKVLIVYVENSNHIKWAWPQ
jgi:hypothetical protein